MRTTKSQAKRQTAVRFTAQLAIEIGLGVVLPSGRYRATKTRTRVDGVSWFDTAIYDPLRGEGNRRDRAREN
jgi:hypothetical protein